MSRYINIEKSDIERAVKVIAVMKIISGILFLIAVMLLIFNLIQSTKGNERYSNYPILANEEDIRNAMSNSEPKLYWIQNQHLEGTEIEDDKGVIIGKYLYISRLAYTCSAYDSISHHHHNRYSSEKKKYKWNRTSEKDSYNVSEDGISLFGSSVILSPETVYYSANESYADKKDTYYYPSGKTSEYSGNIKAKYHVIISSDMVTMLALVGNNHIVQQSVENGLSGDYSIFCNMTVADVNSATTSENITVSIIKSAIVAWIGLIIFIFTKIYKKQINMAIEEQNQRSANFNPTIP